MEGEGVLPCTVDIFNGVSVTNADALPPTPEAFRNRLRVSLEQWRREKRRGVWVQLPLSRAALVPVCVELGFAYHSVEAGNLIMKMWLPSEEPCMLPDGPSHTIGVGGFVYNFEKNELLVIAEKYTDRPTVRAWKLPGGYVKAGEALSEAVEREVLEETSVRAEFVGVLNFRHLHPLLFNCSDIYFVCLLKPQTFETHPEAAEIAEVRWMPIEEYIAHNDVNVVNKRIASSFLENIKSVEGGVDGLLATNKVLTIDEIEHLPEWAKKKTFHDLFNMVLPKSG